MYSLLEQHIDGSWWYHPGDTFETEEEVENAFRKRFWWDLERPHRSFKHDKPLLQEHSTCLMRNGEAFGFGGMVLWTEKQGLIRL